jgi:hypothetical protein
MNNNEKKDKFVRVLETVLEVIGVVLMLAPFLQSKGRRKGK